MPQLLCELAIMDLNLTEDEIWKKIKTRTEIRYAQKNEVVVREVILEKESELSDWCILTLKNLLIQELVPYSSVFEEILFDKKSMVFVAYKHDLPISFIVVKNNILPNFTGNVSRLEISATDPLFKKLCPNYLLIWEASNVMRKNGYHYFNLDLVSNIGFRDSDLERVGFFKRKWTDLFIVQPAEISWCRYLYLRFFKQFRSVKRIVYMIKS